MVFETYFAKKSGMVRVAVLVIIIINLAFVSTGCDRPENSAKHTFYYYPDKNIYYDVSHQRFLYSLDEARTWQTFAPPQNGDTATLGRKIVIAASDSVVYANNEAHRKLYGGSLYKYATENAAISVNTPEVTERKVPVKKTLITPAKTEEKQKKGIGKFIANLFGKHKKK
jgi:hypothetical protein